MTRAALVSIALRARLASIAFDRGGLCAAAVLALYVWVAPAHIVDGDNPEFATLGTIGGVAHPSGYPLYVLWLRALAWLPGSGAHATALATAVLGAAVVLVLHAACRAWGARPLAASCAVAIYAAGPIVMRLCTQAEVFALNALVVATVLWLAARGGPLRGAWRAGALGLVAGLGLANHMTCALVAPVGILGVVRGAREASTARAVATAAAGLVAGLTPYAYLVVAPDSAASWAHIDSLGALVHHVLRLDYGGPGTLSGHYVAVPVLDSLGALGKTLGRGWLWLPGLLGLAMLAVRGARRSGGEGDGDGETRAAWLALAASLLLAGPILLTRFDIPPAGVELFVCQRFHLLPSLLLAVPVALVFEGLARRTAFTGTRAGGAAIALGVLAAASVASLPYVARHGSPAVEQWVRNVLRPLPRDAVVIVAEDELHFGSDYVQLVLGERPDVVVIMWPMIASPAYRAQLARRGIAVPPEGSATLSLEIAEQLLAANRPLFVDAFEANILRTYPTYPFGVVYRVLPKGTPRPDIREVLAINKTVFGSFELGYPLPGPDEEVLTNIHLTYAKTWRIIADALAAAGDADDEAFAREAMREIRARAVKRDRLAGVLVGALAFAWYAYLAPSHIVDGDNAELANLGTLGGAAHPPGYPLYVLWLRAWSQLPLGSPAHVAALATAVLAAAQIVVLYAAARAWGARAAAAAIAVAIYAAAPEVSALSSEAEVFALNGLVAATILWLAAARGPLRGTWRCAALGLAAGAGLANHLTCVLLAPVGLVGIARGVRELAGARARGVAVGAAIAGLALGLVPYAYLLAAPIHEGTWGGLDGLGALVDNFLRRDYGGPAAFNARGGDVAATTSLAALAVTLGRTWWWLLAPAGLAMLGARCVWVVRGAATTPEREPRAGWIALATSFVLAGPVLAARFNIEPTGVGRYLVARFHLLPALLLALPIAALIELALVHAPRLADRGPALAAGAFVLAAVASYPHVARVHVPAVEDEIHNLLRSLPDGAVVIAETDDLDLGIAYAQDVLGERRDVVYIHWPLMGFAWYRAQLVVRGVVLVPDEGRVALVRRLLGAGRPVFVELSQRPVLEAFAFYPYGFVMRVVPPGAPLPSASEVLAINKQIYAGFVHDYPVPAAGDEWPAAVHVRYAHTWELIGKMLAREGHPDDAAWALDQAHAIGPVP